MKNLMRGMRVSIPLLILSAPVLAQERYQDYAFVGAGVTYGESVFSTDGAKAGIEPSLFYNGKYGFIDGSLANYSLTPWLGLSGNLRFAEVSDDFDDISRGIKNRDGNADLGITVGTVGARLTYLQDVTNVHDGYEIQLHLGRAFDTPFDQWVLSPYVEVDYRSKKLSQHLYNVSAQESAASGLAQFDAEETWVYKAGLISLYDVTEQWLAIAKVEFEHHDSNSPLIQNDLAWQISLGGAYKF
ncbi:TPA: MipA/OmpV family protein [Vibrio vulnificus]|nr:MipA/OmpV family protein [Vibrio vulnificus]